jgi:hypothetical protein
MPGQRRVVSRLDLTDSMENLSLYTLRHDHRDVLDARHARFFPPRRNLFVTSNFRHAIFTRPRPRRPKPGATLANSLRERFLRVHNRPRVVSVVLGMACAPQPGPTGAPMTASGTDLRRLIDRARRDEPGALDRLLDSYRNYLRLLARTGLDASLQGKADPSDLVQDALLRASQNFGQFRGASDAELAGWSLLERLQSDASLSPMRDKKAMAELTEAERKAWQKFWADVQCQIRPQPVQRLLAQTGTGGRGAGIRPPDGHRPPRREAGQSDDPRRDGSFSDRRTPLGDRFRPGAHGRRHSGPRQGQE